MRICCLDFASPLCRSLWAPLIPVSFVISFPLCDYIASVLCMAHGYEAVSKEEITFHDKMCLETKKKKNIIQTADTDARFHLWMQNEMKGSFKVLSKQRLVHCFASIPYKMHFVFSVRHLRAKCHRWTVKRPTMSLNVQVSIYWTVAIRAPVSISIGLSQYFALLHLAQ